MSDPEMTQHHPTWRSKLLVLGATAAVGSWAIFAATSTPDKPLGLEDAVSMQTLGNMRTAAENISGHPGRVPLQLGIWLAELIPKGE